MEALLQVFKRDPKYKELEIRLYVDPRQKRGNYTLNSINIKNISETFSNIITELLKLSKNSFNITKTVEFVKTQQSSGRSRKKHRLQLLFPGGGKSKIKSYSSKRDIMNEYETNVHGSYKISLSEEKDITDDPTLMDNYDIIRIKFRISIIIPQFSNFRYDITFVKSLTKDNITSLQGSKNDMLPEKINSKHILRHLPFNKADHIEIEAEYINITNKSLDDLTPKVINDVVNKIYNIINPGQESLAEYHAYMKIISSKVLTQRSTPEAYTKNLVLKKIYNSVKELGRLSYFEQVWPYITNWWLTDKADGKRAIVIVDNKRVVIVSDQLYIISSGSDHYSQDDSKDNITIVDAEFIYNLSETVIKSPKKSILFIFDVIAYEGNNLAYQPFGERIKYLDKSVKLINCIGGKHLSESKPYIKLTKNYAIEIKNMFNRKNRPYNIDGLIFTPDKPSQNDIEYNNMNRFRSRNTTYKNMEVWKWKPETDMSIDFLVRKPPNKFIGLSPAINKPGHTLYYLFCGIKQDVFRKMRLMPVNGYSEMFKKNILSEQYHPIQFSPSLNPLAYLYWHPNKTSIKSLGLVDPTNIEFPLDNVVAEFRLVEGKEDDFSWEIMRVRTDRLRDARTGNDFGNNFTITAEPTWNNFYDPLRFNDLILSEEEYKDRGYWQNADSELHRPQRAFNSFVKTTLIEKYSDQKWVIDLASGKGQDLFRYAKNKIENILFIDKDIHGLSELLRRKNALLVRLEQDPFPMAMYVKQLDLNDNWENNLVAVGKNIDIPSKGVDLVVCNLAFHYLIRDEKHIDNIIKFIHKLTALGGHVIITTLDGKSIFDLLEKHKGKYNVYDETKSILKYSITANYNGKKLSQVGQTIDVLLPFSSGERYTETLVNVEYISKKFERCGFKVKEQGSFSNYLDGFAKSNEDRRRSDMKYKSKHKNGAIVRDKTLNDDDKEYVSLYQYLILTKVKNVRIRSSKKK